MAITMRQLFFFASASAAAAIFRAASRVSAFLSASWAVALVARPQWRRERDPRSAL
jgi:hypothetical protein